MAGKRNPARRIPTRLTATNYKAFLQTVQLQSGYKARIHQLKPGFLKASRAASIPKPLKEYQPRMAVDLLKYFNIRVGDLVKIRFGQDKQKKGIVLETFPNRNQVVVEGCNLNNKIRMGDHPDQIQYVEAPIHVTNVAPVDPVTKYVKRRDVKTITKIKLRRMLTGEYVRLSSNSGCAMPPPVPIATRRNEIAYYKRNILKKLASLPKINVAVTVSRQDRPVNDALSALAVNINQHHRRMSLHSLTQCRVSKSELSPTTVVGRWTRMIKEANISSSTPPVALY